MHPSQWGSGPRRRPARRTAVCSPRANAPRLLHSTGRAYAGRGGRQGRARAAGQGMGGAAATLPILPQAVMRPVYVLVVGCMPSLSMRS